MKSKEGIGNPDHPLGALGGFIYTFLVQFMIFGLVLGCSELQEQAQVAGDRSTSDSEVSNDTEAGIALWKENCASCHGELPETDKLNRSAYAIRSALESVEAMRSVRQLSDREIELIAYVLRSPTDPEPHFEPLDGVALYEANCASCHESIARSTKLGRSAQQIAVAIDAVDVMKPLSTKLGTREIGAIATALQARPDVDPGDSSAEGLALYTRYCESCHFPVENSTKRGVPAEAIARGIASVSAMAHLNILDDRDIDLIAYVLSGVNLPEKGAKPRLRDRHGIESLFRSVFAAEPGSAGAQDVETVLANRLRRFATNHVMTFGGNCSRHDPSCPGAAQVQALYASATTEPNPLRRGFVNSLCNTILSSNLLVRQMIVNLNMNESQAPGRSELVKIHRAFRPGFEPKASVIDALMAVQAQFSVNLDKYRYVAVPVCQSVMVDLL